MEYLSPLLVVKNLEKSKKFYYDVLGLEVIVDFGANVTLTGGVALQTLDSWTDFIHKPASDIAFGGLDSELYFEEKDFDAFIKRLSAMPDIAYVHPAKEHAWGQRAVRILDPDGHIIEIGEDMAAVVKRFRQSGMSVEETAARMDVSVENILYWETV